jgi:acetyl esterase/lipase
MRALFFLALAACDPGAASIHPPPVPGLVLAGADTITLSGSYDLELTGAVPGATYYLVASSALEGPQACSGTRCTDLATPAANLGGVAADASGVVQFSVTDPVPSATSMRFQAARVLGSGLELSSTVTASVVPENPCQAPPPQLGLDPSTCWIPDVKYGPDAKQGFDVLLADTAQPAPLVVFIHGGGFTGGDKAAVYQQQPDTIQAYLDAGVSFATVNYRLLDELDDEGVLKCLGDSRRALQYLRLHADTFGIDPDRVVLSGGSAGAGTSLWLATHDDMADPTAEDPVLRESTRVLGASASGTQSTYDIPRWQTDVYAPVGFRFADMLQADPSFAQRIVSFYGEPTADIDVVFTPDIVDYRREVDIFRWMSPDDPPIHVSNTRPDTTVPTDTGALYHHALHAVALQDFAAAAGMSADVHAPAYGIVSTTTREDFVFATLGLP